MSSSNCCFLTCIQISQEAGQVVWYSHLFQNFPYGQEELPKSEVRGGGPEEPPHTRGQELQPGGATQGVMAVRAQEGLEELSHVEGQEGQW